MSGFCAPLVHCLHATARDQPFVKIGSTLYPAVAIPTDSIIMSRKSSSSAPSQRMLRVGELVRHALADLLARGEIMDPKIENLVITVPEVRMTPDLKLASAYVMPLGGENAAEVVKALNSHARFIRGQLSSRVNMKYSPDIRFFVDDTFEEAGRIDALLRSEHVQQDLAHDQDGDEDKAGD